MSLTLRTYEQHDFGALHRLDQSCFPPGIAYSRITLHYFLSLSSANCLVALDGKKIIGFILSEENPPLGHTVTLDIAADHRRHGIGSALLAGNEKTMALHGVRHVLIETATDNQPAVAFWQRHGYRIEAILKRYYLGRIDAYEMRKILPSSVTPSSVAKDRAESSGDTR
jgi:ribosomal-protein-alanine N-acetyltransferase